MQPSRTFASKVKTQAQNKPGTAQDQGFSSRHWPRRVEFNLQQPEKLLEPGALGGFLVAHEAAARGLASPPPPPPPFTAVCWDPSPRRHAPHRGSLDLGLGGRQVPERPVASAALASRGTGAPRVLTRQTAWGTAAGRGATVQGHKGARPQVQKGPCPERGPRACAPRSGREPRRPMPHERGLQKTRPAPPRKLPRAGRARPALPLAPPPLGLALSISLDAVPFNPTGFFMLHFYFHSIQCIF